MNDGMTTSPTAAITKSPVCVNLKDITGQRFGRLVVLRREGKNSSGQATWRCVCDCKRETVQAGSTLRAGIVVSCKCYGIEARRAATKTHGLSNAGYYGSYKEMLRRCQDPRHIEWLNYGGRTDNPIRVCERWLKIENFAEDMGASWQPGLSIERRDVNGHYCPENCCWVTMKVQNNNKRNTKRIEYKEESLTKTEWAERAKLSLPAFLARIKAGKTMDEIMSTPVGKYTRKAP